MSKIHPTAIIEDGAEIHASVSVGPYSIIESGARIGANSIIETHVRIYPQARLGTGNRVCDGVTLGSEPQDLGYDAAQAKPLVIGDNNHFKEGVNISHGIKEDHGTMIGNHNYLMAYCHVGHDCILGDHNIMVNAAGLAGHVTMEDHIFLSGHSAVHQFCRIGSYAMIGGLSGVSQDVPPYVMADGYHASISGLNTVGLRRAGFQAEQRRAIKGAYRTIYKSSLKLRDALEQLSTDQPTDEVEHIIAFIQQSKRGIISHK